MFFYIICDDLRLGELAESPRCVIPKFLKKSTRPIGSGRSTSGEKSPRTANYKETFASIFDKTPTTKTGGPCERAEPPPHLKTPILQKRRQVEHGHVSATRAAIVSCWQCQTATIIIKNATKWKRGFRDFRDSRQPMCSHGPPDLEVCNADANGSSQTPIPLKF